VLVFEGEKHAQFIFTCPHKSELTEPMITVVMILFLDERHSTRKIFRFSTL